MHDVPSSHDLPSVRLPELFLLALPSRVLARKGYGDLPVCSPLAVFKLCPQANLLRPCPVSDGLWLAVSHVIRRARGTGRALPLLGLQVHSGAGGCAVAFYCAGGNMQLRCGGYGITDHAHFFHLEMPVRTVRQSQSRGITRSMHINRIVVTAAHHLSSRRR